MYKKPRVLLRYTTCGTTMEQHYAHIAGLTIAAALGGDVVVPPWLAATDAEQSSSQQPQSFREVWDAEHLGRWAAEVKPGLSRWASRSRPRMHVVCVSSGLAQQL